VSLPKRAGHQSTHPSVNRPLSQILIVSVEMSLNRLSAMSIEERQQSRKSTGVPFFPSEGEEGRRR